MILIGGNDTGQNGIGQNGMDKMVSIFLKVLIQFMLVISSPK